MVTVYISLKYRRTYQSYKAYGGFSVSVFSLFPYGISESIFTKCGLQKVLCFLKGGAEAFISLKKNNNEEL